MKYHTLASPVVSPVASPVVNPAVNPAVITGIQMIQVMETTLEQAAGGRSFMSTKICVQEKAESRKRQ